MREVFAFVALGLALSGCAQEAHAPVRFAETLGTQAPPPNVIQKLVPPSGDCLTRARHHVADESDILREPLPIGTRARVERILEGLHPVAKQVLARTSGIWLAENMPGAAAVFLPCSVNRQAATGGFILLDLSEFHLDGQMRDAEVPALYWRSLAGPSGVRPTSYSVKPMSDATATRSDH